MRTDRHIALTLLPVLAGGLAAPAAHGTDDAVVIQDQPAGHLKVQQAGDGWIETGYSYRNNGRGPDLRERIRIDAKGMPVA